MEKRSSIASCFDGNYNSSDEEFKWVEKNTRIHRSSSPRLTRTGSALINLLSTLSETLELPSIPPGAGVELRMDEANVVGRTAGAALFEAVKAGKVHLARFILDAAASHEEQVEHQDTTEGGEITLADAQDISGKTPLMAACLGSMDDRLRIPIIDMLLSRGANPNARCERGRTSLSYACEQRCNSVVQHLIGRASVDPNIPDEKGNTPLMYCAIVGNHIGIDILLRSFKRLGVIDVNFENKKGFSALILAAKYGHIKSANLLADKGGAFVSAKDPETGLTAEEWARRAGFTTSQIVPLVPTRKLTKIIDEGDSSSMDESVAASIRSRNRRRVTTGYKINRSSMGYDSSEQLRPAGRPTLMLRGRADNFMHSMRTNTTMTRAPAPKKKNNALKPPEIHVNRAFAMRMMSTLKSQNANSGVSAAEEFILPSLSGADTITAFRRGFIMGKAVETFSTAAILHRKKHRDIEDITRGIAKGWRAGHQQSRMHRSYNEKLHKTPGLKKDHNRSIHDLSISGVPNLPGVVHSDNVKTGYVPFPPNLKKSPRTDNHHDTITTIDNDAKVSENKSKLQEKDFLPKIGDSNEGMQSNLPKDDVVIEPPNETKNIIENELDGKRSPLDFSQDSGVVKGSD